MKLSEHVYLIASGNNGLAMTSALDCNVYLIDTGEGLILVDAGADYEFEMMDAVLKGDGFDWKDVKKIVLTHYHSDHSGGAAKIKSLSGCEVYAPEKEAPFIIAGDTEQLGMEACIRAGFTYPEGYVYHPCPDVKPLYDGDTVSLGNVSLQVFLTPGHSLQDLLLYGEIDGKKCLFTGDAIFPKGEVLLQNLPDVSIYSYSQGLERLRDLEVDAMYAGHREPVLNRAKRHVELCLAGFDSMLIPAQLTC